MLKYLMCVALCATFTIPLSAQGINPEIFERNIAILYDAAAKGFKDIKTDMSGKTNSGHSKYHSTKKVSGAKEVFIEVDEESSHTYVAHFEAKDLDAAKQQIEQMAELILTQVADKGFYRSSGTEIEYEGYRKQTVEFETDNIDLMGRYPSFSLGVLKGTDPPVIEMIVNEPLWK